MKQFGAAAGNNNGDTLTDQAGNTYTYTAWDQIATVKNSSGTTIATYAYNAAGQRITEAEGGTTTNLLYDGQQIIEERQGSTVTDQYVYNIDYVNDVLLRDDNSTSGSLGISGSGLGERLFSQHDANFDVTALTNTSGVVVQRMTYGAYGTMTVLSPSWASATEAYSFNPGFQGMWQDMATGLYYTPNRDYSTALGRWMGQDPAGFANGSDLYQFCGSDPADIADPSGLRWTRREGLPTYRASWCASSSSDTWDDLAKLTHFEPAERDKWLGEQVQGSPTIGKVYTVPNVLYKVKGQGKSADGDWSDEDLSKMLNVGTSEFTGQGNNYFVVDKPASNFFAAIDDPNIAVIVAAGHGTHDETTRGGKQVQLQGLLVTDQMRPAAPNVVYPIDALTYLKQTRGYHLAGMSMIVCSAGSGGWASLVSTNGTLWANDNDINNNWIIDALFKGGREGWEAKTFGLTAHAGTGSWTIPPEKPQPDNPFVPAAASTQPAP